METNLESINKSSFLIVCKEYIATLSFLSVFAYSLIIYPFAFNFETYEHGYYIIALVTIVAFFFNSLLSVLNKEDSADYYDLLLLMLLVSHIYWLNNGNEYAIIIVISIIQFYLLKTVNLGILKIILYIVFASYIAEIIFATYNLIFNNSKSLTGSLHNTGVFAIYAIIFIPLCRYLMQKHLKRSYFKLIFFAFTGIVLAIIFVVKSRTSIIALALVFFLPYFFFYLKKQHLYVKIFLVTGLGLASVYFFRYLFYLKSGSSTGRLLMLKVAFSHLCENFWWGVGLGKFTFQYPKWQADFFKNPAHLDLGYFLSASDTYVIFNEFVQLFITIGFVCFFLLGFFLLRFFHKKPLIENDLFEMIKSTFLIILACSLTYYTIHINVVLFLISLYIALSFKILKRSQQAILNNIQNITIKLLICTSSFFTLVYTYTKYNAIHEWIEIKAGFSSLKNKSNPELNTIYSTLKNDGKFLAEYGNYLYENGHGASTAISYLEQSKKTFISRQNIEDLAYLYLEQKNYSKAIENFEWLINYIPCGFRNRLELLKLYVKTSAIHKAKKMAVFSLNMPIKIPSEEVLEIKKEILSINQQLINKK